MMLKKLLLLFPSAFCKKPLDKASINFTPPIDDYVNAAKQIGYGTVIKVILQFKEAFWKKDTGFILSDEIIPTWWTQLPSPLPILTGWSGGSKAERLGDEGNDELLKKPLLSLANIFSLRDK
jgi:monoamine oxidase